MSALRIGFIGCGVIAWAHALALEGLANGGVCDTTVAAAFDIDERREDRFVRRFGGDRASSMDEVAERADAVYVCTSTSGHVEGVRAAARAKLPIFCEKPLARNLPETLSLIAAATTPAQVGLVLRTAPVFRELKRIVSSGELGRPMACIWRDDQFFPIQGHYASKWRSDVNIAGAGALLEHTIHDVDIITDTFGEVEWVGATVGGFSGFEGIEDSASALISTASGLSVSLVTVWHQVLSRKSTRRVEVLFERGFLTLDDDFTGPITIQTTEGVEVRECPPPAWVLEVPLPEGEIGLAVRPYVEENRDFVTAVVQGAHLSPTLADALVAHEIVDACYRSAEAGGVPTRPAKAAGR